MNIFFLSEDPVLAAQFQCDKHVVKMVLETAQLLSTTHRVLETEGLPDFLYKKTHANHPCAIWTRSSLANYKWLATHGIALTEEYTYRYNKRHKSEPILDWLNLNIPSLSDKTFNQPPQAMPDEYKHFDCVTAYRQYYLEHKMKTIKCEWTKRERPWWTYVDTQNF